MWTNENRGRSDRSGLRYPSDLTNEEWALVEQFIAPARRGGAKRTVDVREVVNGLMYVLSTDCQRRAIPKDLPPNARATSQRRQATLRHSHARGFPVCGASQLPHLAAPHLCECANTARKREMRTAHAAQNAMRLVRRCARDRADVGHPVDAA